MSQRPAETEAAAGSPEADRAEERREAPSRPASATDGRPAARAADGARTGRSLAAPAEPIPGLSVAMMVRDEADRLPRSLASVRGAEEVVVLDSRSTDRTAEVARAFGARVVRAEEWPGYGEQRRRSVELVRGPWVLCLDADEVVTPALAAEIRALLADGPEAAGYEITFQTRYLGHWFGRRGWYRERHLRLARTDAMRVSTPTVHEGIRVRGPVGRLRAPILHYSYRSVAHHLEKIREYSHLKAVEYRRRGRHATLPSALGHAAWCFLTGYLARGRFLDGWPGLAWQALRSFETLSAHLQLWEMTRAGGRSPGDADGLAGRAADAAGDEAGGVREGGGPEADGDPRW